MNMTIAPMSPVAIQIQKPMNPTVDTEIRGSVVTTGTVNFIPEDAPTSFRDAVLAASQFSKANHVAVGVSQSGGRLGNSSAYFLSTLGTQRAGGVQPLNFDAVTTSPGAPYTDRFERTLFGAGATDGPVLQAIVGANSFAAFTGGYDGKVTSLAALTA